jgi:hypothetical protein
MAARKRNTFMKWLLRFTCPLAVILALAFPGKANACPM